MSYFIDREAVESEDEEELTDAEWRRAQQLKAVVDSSDEDEEDTQRFEEDLPDLIDDNPIEEHSDSDSESDTGCRKRKNTDDEFDERFEDEDYELIEENLGVKVKRPKKFKRVRRIEDEEDEVNENREDREGIENELLIGDPDNGGEQQLGPIQEDYVEEGEDGESDLDDFIVDEDGQPVSQGKKKRKPTFNNAALREAQDIFGVEFDREVFDTYQDEDEEEEEDDYSDESGEERREKSKKTGKKPTHKTIFEIYEPSELRRGHFTDFDHQIRKNDIPERMQLREVPVTPVPKDSNELKEEAEWIYKQAFCKPTITTQDCKGGADPRSVTKKGNSTIGKIEKTLDFMRNEYLEVAFIAFYRKEYILPELNVNDLWRIHKYDAKWCQLTACKNALLKLFESMRDYQLEEYTQDLHCALPDEIRLLGDDDILQLKAVQTPEELDDVRAHFQLYYGHLITEMQEKKRAKAREERRQYQLDETTEQAAEEDDQEIIKPATRSGPYAICRKAKLDGFAKRFGLRPEKFAENFRDNYQRHDIEQEGISPHDLAAEYCGEHSLLKNPAEVLKSVKFMVATQLSVEPLVRKVMRDAVFERARINVVPTQKGTKEIDENHPCFGVKYLKGKPVRELVGVEFLKLHIAEEDGLLKISFDEDIEGLNSQSYLEEMKALYIKDEFSNVVQEWNDLRLDCVDLAYRTMLWPSIVKELRAQLLAEAKECVLKLCSQKLYNWLKVAGYRVDFEEGKSDDDWDTSEGLRVMGVAYVSDFEQAPFACILAPDGECIEYKKLPNLLKRKNSWREEERVAKENDLRELRNFIRKKKPHAICVSAESRDAQFVVADLKEIAKELVEDEQFPLIPVEILDNDLAKVYSNSIKGNNEFRDYPVVLRQAISLARRLQDPLVEFSQLCNTDEEILCLRYHSLQDSVAKEDLMDVITREFVNRTNEVGVNLNEIIKNVYSGVNLLQYVCGLGPRKATALIKLLKQTNKRLENRTLLVTHCHMGPKIFTNCAGFIKIDTDALEDRVESYDVEVLDGTRVHPEAYNWARKMAVDALEYEDEEDNQNQALHEILKSPKRLKDLDLDAFGMELERQGYGNKSVTLYDIRAELNCKYKDGRVSYEPPNGEELFDLLTKETPETFYIGKLVQATVTGISRKKPDSEQLNQANPVRKDESGLWQCPFCLRSDFLELAQVWNHFDAGGCPGKATGVLIRLDNGVSGYIHAKNLSDKHVTDLEERVYHGQVIHCRIMKITVEKFSVEATSKSSDLVDSDNKWRPPKDFFYDYAAEEQDRLTQQQKVKKKAAQTYVKRVITHPSFKNCTFAESMVFLKDMDQGECLIRPSSKGSDHLTLTWKVTKNIYQHIDILEKDKKNSFSLGRSLWIEKEEFEDLEEIISRHICPMAACARDLINYKYYHEADGGKREQAEGIVLCERKQNPEKCCYLFSACADSPGKFLLSYSVRGFYCKHEYLKVTPAGYLFRNKIFENVFALLKWFKNHFRDPIPKISAFCLTPSDYSAYPTPHVQNFNGPTAGTSYSIIAPANYAAYVTPVIQNTPSMYQTPLQTMMQSPFPRPMTTPHNAPDWCKIAAEWSITRT